MYDLIVIGLGIHGAAIAAEAGVRGFRVLAVDKFSPPHGHGSSHGGSRLFRLTTLEADEYVPIARRALEKWKDLDTDTGNALIIPTGFALISEPNTENQVHHGVNNLVERARELGRRHGIPHEHMTGKDLMRAYPDLHVGANDRVYYEPNAFIIKPEAAVEALLARAKGSGHVEIRTGQEATDIQYFNGKVTVQLEGRRQKADRVVLATGPWGYKAMLNSDPVRTSLKPQLTLRLEDAAAVPTRFPAFAYASRRNTLLYAIPPSPSLPEVKVGSEQGAVTIGDPDPALLPSSFCRSQRQEITEGTARILPSLNLDNSASDLCFYTVTRNSRHIVKRLGPGGAVTIVSACSGHGFKYAPAIAERVVNEAVRGRPALNRPQ